MTHYICFANKGEIDIDAAITLGVNVKLSEHPIGYFGTGLKYAIAVLLREGQAVRIRSGLREFLFEAKPKDIRGESFDMIVLREVLDPPPRAGSRAGKRQLGFTTAFGRNWSLRQAYRELYSNMRDEGGEVSDAERLPRAKAGWTQIIIRGEEFFDVHRASAEFILANKSHGEPLYSDDELEVYAGESQDVFYKGIAAHAAGKPYKFTYNILKDCSLTEDRTLAGWEVDYVIKRWAILRAPQAQAEAIIARGAEPRAEDEFNYETSFYAPSPTFRAAARAVPAKRSNSTALKLSQRGAELSELRAIDTPESVPSGICRMENWGFPYTNVNVLVAEDLAREGEDWVFDAKRVQIWLSAACAADEDRLDLALLRGWFASRGYAKQSEAQESAMLVAIVRLGREVTQHEARLTS